VTIIDSKDRLVLCPDTIAVIGGGRWARVIIEVLYGIVPQSVRISVHSPRNAEFMSAWVSDRGFGQCVHVSSDWPHLYSVKSKAAIIVNAARDHERAIDWALSACVPVLVEKPISLNAAASQRLVNMARSKNQCFGAAHIFLFASYLENFSKLVAEAKKIRFIRVYWKDPQYESRYGEQKQYDPGLPIFADWLPHVLSIVGTLTPNLPQKCERLKLLRGGAHLELELMLGDIPCSVQLIRNGDIRQRIIEVYTEQKMLQIDFSKEPGSIMSGSTSMCGDPDWDGKQRPLARMLTSFLKWAAGGEFDNRLSIEIGLRANQVIDQILGMYSSALMPWLIAKLTSPVQVDEDLCYALSEIFQSEGSLPAKVIEQKIERVREQFSGTGASHWLRVLAEGQKPSMILRSIAS